MKRGLIEGDFIHKKSSSTIISEAGIETTLRFLSINVKTNI